MGRLTLFLQDKCFVGQTENGVYVDDCAGVHPDIIEEFYGVEQLEEDSEYEPLDSDDEKGAWIARYGMRHD